MLVLATRAFTLVYVPVDVDAVIGVNLLPVLAVQLVELLEQIVLQVRLNHVLVEGLLTLQLLLVEDFAELANLYQRDGQQRFEMLRIQTRTGVKG